MSDTHGAKNEGTLTDEPPTWARWERNLTYALLWVPPIAILLAAMTCGDPVFCKLDEKGNLPHFSRLLWMAARFNEQYFFLPVVFVFAMLRALAEYCIIVSRNFRHRKLCLYAWLLGVVCVGLLLWFICVRSAMAPLFIIGGPGKVPPRWL